MFYEFSECLLLLVLVLISGRRRDVVPEVDVNNSLYFRLMTWEAIKL
jgi:hypothetical protein